MTIAVPLKWNMRRAALWEEGGLTELYNEQGPPKTTLEVGRQTCRDGLCSWELRWQHLGQPLEDPGESMWVS